MYTATTADPSSAVQIAKAPSVAPDVRSTSAAGCARAYIGGSGGYGIVERRRGYPLICRMAFFTVCRRLHNTVTYARSAGAAAPLIATPRNHACRDARTTPASDSLVAAAATAVGAHRYQACVRRSDRCRNRWPTALGFRLSLMMGHRVPGPCRRQCRWSGSGAKCGATVRNLRSPPSTEPPRRTALQSDPLGTGCNIDFSWARPTCEAT